MTKRISDPPRLEDFDQLTLPEEDVERLEDVQGRGLRAEAERSLTDAHPERNRLVEADGHIASLAQRHRN